MSFAFISGSPMDRLHAAVQSQSPQAIHAASLPVSRQLRQLKQDADNDDLVAVLGHLATLGIDVAKILAEVGPYLNIANGAVKLINSILDMVANANTKTKTIPFVMHVRAGDHEILPYQVDVSIAIDKASKGWVFLDNYEYVDTLTVSVKEANRLPLAAMNLTLQTSGFGFGQDDCAVPLKLKEGDGGGSDTAQARIVTKNKWGTEVHEYSLLDRNNFTKAEYEIDSGPGKIEYGLDGFNVVAEAKIWGQIILPHGAQISVPPISVMDMGLSI